ncbi:TPA: hypothetical protein ACGOVM_000319 [Streptococcus suis]
MTTDSVVESAPAEVTAEPVVEAISAAPTVDETTVVGPASVVKEIAPVVERTA